MLIRGVKIAFVAFVGVFGVLTGADNIVDYSLNFEAVRHILAMDTIHRQSPLMTRAITSPELQHIAYWIIIAAELLYGALCLLGALRLCFAWRRDQNAFEAAKFPATLGLYSRLCALFFWLSRHCRRMVPDVAIVAMERAALGLSLPHIDRAGADHPPSAGRELRTQ